MVDNAELPKKIMEDFEAYCEKHKITGKQKEEKLQKLREAIIKYMYEPGEAIGIISAQSISEPATQMTMRSYTLASQSDRLSKVTQGLPRLIEIFDARKTFEKNMMIHLKPEYSTKEKTKDVANRIKETKVSDIIISDSIDIVELRIELELESDEYKEELKSFFSKNMKNTEINTKGNFIYIKPEKVDDIRGLRKLKNKLLKHHICGIKGVEDVLVLKEGDSWVIQTIGTNLKNVLKMPEVDISKTTTNDMHQVYDVMGIEAARNVLMREAKQTLDEQGLDVDMRHLILLCDMMTFDGQVRDIGRYGVSGKKASVLARANFEETKKHIVNASFYGERDDMKGTIENILIGQVAPIGTGMIELTVDTEKMKAMVKKK